MWMETADAQAPMAVHLSASDRLCVVYHRHRLVAHGSDGISGNLPAHRHAAQASVENRSYVVSLAAIVHPSDSATVSVTHQVWRSDACCTGLGAVRHARCFWSGQC